MLPGGMTVQQLELLPHLQGRILLPLGCNLKTKNSKGPVFCCPFLIFFSFFLNSNIGYPRTFFKNVSLAFCFINQRSFSL